jgi:copper chaperone
VQSGKPRLLRITHYSSLCTLHSALCTELTPENIMETAIIPVKGMTCMGCVSSVKRVLGGINGVAGAEVSLEQAQATVTYDPGKASLEALKTAITDAGYDVA